MFHPNINFQNHNNLTKISQHKRTDFDFYLRATKKSMTTIQPHFFLIDIFTLLWLGNSCVQYVWHHIIGVSFPSVARQVLYTAVATFTRLPTPKNSLSLISFSAHCGQLSSSALSDKKKLGCIAPTDPTWQTMGPSNC